MPSFRQIQYFLTVADLGGFTQGAAALFIAQSALSRQISQLEEELGFLLFEREWSQVAKFVFITQAGHNHVQWPWKKWMALCLGSFLFTGMLFAIFPDQLGSYICFIGYDYKFNESIQIYS